MWFCKHFYQWISVMLFYQRKRSMDWVESVLAAIFAPSARASKVKLMHKKVLHQSQKFLSHRELLVNFWLVLGVAWKLKWRLQIKLDVILLFERAWCPEHCRSYIHGKKVFIAYFARWKQHRPPRFYYFLISCSIVRNKFLNLFGVN